MSLAAGQFTADQYKKRAGKNSPIGYIVPIIVLDYHFFDDQPE